MHTARQPVRPPVRSPARLDHPALATAAHQRIWLSDELRRAIEQDAVALDCEPVCSLLDGRPDHHELRLRWDAPGKGRLEADALIRLAEESGQMLALGDWMLERAAAILRRKPASEGCAADAVSRLVLRVCPMQLQAADAYFERWLDRLDSLGLARERLVLGIAEPTLSARADTLLPVLARLRGAGLQIALDHVDDAGSLASLHRRHRLHELGARTLKIDPDRLRGIEHDAQALVQCEGLIELAHRLDLQVIADGIESATRRAVLEAIGCDLGQGRLFATATHD